MGDWTTAAQPWTPDAVNRMRWIGLREGGKVSVDVSVQSSVVFWRRDRLLDLTPNRQMSEVLQESLC